MGTRTAGFSDLTTRQNYSAAVNGRSEWKENNLEIGMMRRRLSSFAIVTAQLGQHTSLKLMPLDITYTALLRIHRLCEQLRSFVND